MAQPRYCGIDFGTSNSTVAVPHGNDIKLAPVEGAHETIPSAIFFSFSEGPLFGRRAIRDYTDHEPGRLMRALKSILGYGLFHEKTRLQKQNLALSDVLGLFIGHLKTHGEQFIEQELDAVVLGRPVQFIEGDADADRQAQDDLEAATRKRGFKHIGFQFEPIAAALEYESSVSAEELVLIVDIGGGTADFSVVRVSPERARKADRSGDILANRGIRIGGTDFDRMLSMHYVMPHFGLGSHYGEKKLEVPRALFLDLSTWSRINFLYNQTTLSTVRSLRRESEEREKFDRLLQILEQHDGHRLIETVERAKIDLTANAKTTVDLHRFVPDLRIALSRMGMAKAVAPGVTRIIEAISATLKDAGLKRDQIDTVFMTGGSSLMPAVQKEVSQLLQRDDLASGDMFGAVGRGLGLDARRRFA
ncbi:MULTISPECIES: Hsp70 family protein [unclassified Beijerinckia]|uniref:Hsp70 family protein n=1 Tax=unclassified Beijerinckia TaxID=2638183 RepID=UPI000B82AA94|nr:MULTISPECIES: Hsp70 family protein [unclassified Beijerinckia]